MSSNVYTINVSTCKWSAYFINKRKLNSTIITIYYTSLIIYKTTHGMLIRQYKDGLKFLLYSSSQEAMNEII
jgi:hypothetical protein